jgi:peptidyl-prolyl cis-trans isomerase B (cyclophilin B)
MKNLLSVVVFVAMVASVSAQDLTNVNLSLFGPALVSAKADVNLRLVIEIEADTQVPAQLLTGCDLTVRCNAVAQPAIKREGRGGPVALSKGTLIERVLTIPASQFFGDQQVDEVMVVAVGWLDQVGVDCTFKVAPDTSNLSVADLDLEKTKVMLVTNYGEMLLSFRPDKAPRHVENFVKLCLQGFYDQTKFHRVLRNFMIQGGCPFTKDDSLVAKWGTGGSETKIALEPSDLRHLRGTLSMARASDPDSASSGFFIVHKDSPHLDNGYSAFGNLEEGMDTLDRIANQAVAGPTKSAPIKPVILEAAVVLPKKK